MRFPGFYPIKRDHFGPGRCGFYTRLGLYTRSFDMPYMVIKFTALEAQQFCYKLDKEHKPARHEWHPISLTKEEKYIVECVDIFWAEFGMMPPEGLIPRLMISGAKPADIIGAFDGNTADYPGLVLA